RENQVGRRRHDPETAECQARAATRSGSCKSDACIASPRDAEQKHECDCTTHRPPAKAPQRALWVQSGKTQNETIKSALTPKADIVRRHWHVRFVPCVDGSELARLFYTFAGWSVQPCVRPVRAAHKAAGHNAFRGSGPGQNRGGGGVAPLSRHHAPARDTPAA